MRLRSKREREREKDCDVPVCFPEQEILIIYVNRALLTIGIDKA